MADHIEDTFTLLEKFIKLKRVRFLKPTKVSIAICIMFGISTFVAAVTSGDSPLLTEKLSVAIGFYVGIWSQVFWYRFTNTALQVCSLLLSAAKCLHLKATDDMKKDMTDTAKHFSSVIKIMSGYVVVTFPAIVVTPLILKRPLTMNWPYPESNVGLYLFILLEETTLVFAGIAAVQVIPFVYGMNIINASLFRVLGRAIEQDNNRETVQVLVQVHQKLLSASRSLNGMYCKYLMHMLSAALVPPLFVLRDLSLRRAPAIQATACAPMIFIMFLSWCLSGQELENASSGVKFSCYIRNWTDDDVQTRKTLLMMMNRGMRHCSIVVYGLGVLNRKTGLSVLKTWFSYVQLLLKT